MISDANITNLQRLTRGKYKLDQSAMQLLIQEIQDNPCDQLLIKIFPVKVSRQRKPPKPKPEWLEAMLNARKKISWSAKEATEKLFEIADTEGLELKSAKQKSFPKAAEQIADQLGHEKTRDLFVNWVTEFVNSHQMV